jgi:hypothetical protein
MPSAKAAGADDITREALDACPAALDDFLRLVTACIHKEEFPPSAMLVIFVMLYKGKGDVNDMSRHRAIGLQTLVLKVAAGWLTMTRFKVLYGNYVQLTQTAYQKSKSFESNLMWVTQCIATVCALGRSAVLPLVDASGAFDSLSWRFIDWTFKRNEGSFCDLSLLAARHVGMWARSPTPQDATPD